MGPLLPAIRTGDLVWTWTGEDVTYKSLHLRLRQQRGPAKRFACIGCGGPAAEWAFDHTGEQKISPEGYLYSTDLERYQPMCVPCHRQADLERRRAA